MHGITGAKILRKEKLPEKYARVCERHLGAGITKKDIKKYKLKMPLKDYVPKTKEEKIIACADNRMFGDKMGSVESMVKRFARDVSPEYGERIRRLHNQIQKLYKSRKKR
jgi:HD superfamily phosphodiesterase